VRRTFGVPSAVTSCRLSGMTGFDGEVAAFRRRLEAAGLGRFADPLVRMARPSVRLVADSALPLKHLLPLGWVERQTCPLRSPGHGMTTSR
jgi:hypothetical protein